MPNIKEEKLMLVLRYLYAMEHNNKHHVNKTAGFAMSRNAWTALNETNNLDVLTVDQVCDVYPTYCEYRMLVARTANPNSWAAGYHAQTNKN